MRTRLTCLTAFVAAFLGLRFARPHWLPPSAPTAAAATCALHAQAPDEPETANVAATPAVAQPGTASPDDEPLREAREAHPFQSADMPAELVRLWDMAAPLEADQKLREAIRGELQQRFERSVLWRSSLREQEFPAGPTQHLPAVADAAECEAFLLLQKFDAGEFRVIAYDILPLPLQSVGHVDFFLAAHPSRAARTLLLFRIDREADAFAFAAKQRLRDSMPKSLPREANPVERHGSSLTPFKP